MQTIKPVAAVTKQVQDGKLGAYDVCDAEGRSRTVALAKSTGLRLTGGATFGWKYVVGGYEHGEATFNGKPLLAQTRSTFLFRTFGEK